MAYSANQNRGRGRKRYKGDDIKVLKPNQYWNMIEKSINQMKSKGGCSEAV